MVPTRLNHVTSKKPYVLGFDNKLGRIVVVETFEFRDTDLHQFALTHTANLPTNIRLLDSTLLNQFSDRVCLLIGDSAFPWIVTKVGSFDTHMSCVNENNNVIADIRCHSTLKGSAGYFILVKFL